MISKVVILGERVSGTSFMQSLITYNTNLKVDQTFGHKHFLQDTVKISKTDTTDTLFLFITRDIMEWLQSFNNNTFHADLPIRRCTDFSKFIRMEWKCIEDETSGVSQLDPKYGKEMMCERDHSSGERYQNVIKMRTGKIRHLLVDVGCYVENFEHVKYEYIRDNPERWLIDLSNKYDIILKPYRPVKSVRGKGKVAYKRKDYPPISEDDQLYIFENMSKEVEEYLGYI